MNKELKNYDDRYGGIPESYTDRMSLLTEDIKPKQLVRLKEMISYIRSIRYNKIYMVFYMVPKATPRARLGRFKSKKVFYVSGAAFNRSLFKEFIESQGEIKDIIKTPCKLTMDAYFPSDSLNKLEKVLGELRLVYPISIPDVDNVAKTYMDMIQGHLIMNDSLVIDLHIRKFYSIKPRIELAVEYMNEFDCKYNEIKVSKWKVIDR